MKPPPIHEPFTGAELLGQLGAVREWGAEFWSSFDDRDFFAPLGDAWSPADNVRHLIRSNRPVARALTVPRFVLQLRFGFSRQSSRSYSALRADYREALAGGLQAGSFAPSALPSDRETAAERLQILTRWSDSIADLESALEKWSERALDRVRLPHPGLGLLTVREMLFFTLYHNTHHALGVAQRTER